MTDKKLSDVTVNTINGWISKGERFEARWCAPYLFMRFRAQDKSPSWRFRIKLKGKQLPPVTIGKYPIISLADARAESKRLYARVALGHDVAAEKSERIKSAHDIREANKNAYTVARLADEYFDRQIAGKVKHSNIPLRQLDKDIKPVIGHLKVDEIKPKHIDDVLQKILKRNAPTSANDVLHRLKALFKYAVKRHLIEYNPASNFDIADAGGRERKRARALSTSDLVKLFANIRNNPRVGLENTLTIKLLLALCVRKEEFTASKWSEFDLYAGIWSLPEHRTKTKAGIVIPLAPPVIEWLQELKRLAGSSEYVLPARKMQKTMQPYINHSTINRAIALIQTGIEHFTVHDFRRTARTHLSAITNDKVAEKCINHNSGTYDRYDYFEERKSALKTWANLLKQYDSDFAENVVSIKSKQTA